VKLTKTFNEFNQVELQKIFMSFNILLKLLSIVKETHINALRIKLKRLTIFLQRLCKDI
jgi:hypothetical protein